jgi:hypothetical protein
MQAWRRCCFCLCQAAAAAAAAAAASAVYICASVELKHVHCVLQEVLVASAGVASLQFVANRWPAAAAAANAHFLCFLECRLCISCVCCRRCW